MANLIHPIHYLTIESTPNSWSFEIGKVFYNPRGVAVPKRIDDLLKGFGLIKLEVIIELFRAYGGKLGYYLVDLREKKYYYCGLDFESIRSKLLELGIGRADPLESP